MATVRTLDVHPDLPIDYAEAGSGRAVLVLHGGAGPAPFAPLVEHLARGAHVIAPVHPGFNGTPRPPWLTGVDDYALAYLHLLQDLGLREVTVVGSSLGGWIASELAVRDTGGTVSSLVLLDAAGIEVPGEPMVDVETLAPRALAEHSWHDPRRGLVDPATLPPEQLAVRHANQETVRLLKAGRGLYDPKLRRRLGRVRVPTLVVWGESDRLVTPAYGRAYAAAFPDARFELVKAAGHMPMLEQPEVTLRLIDEHLRRTAR
ncbi:alpha/beta fold hydrolase [Streptacidiphilus jiangxiensis]|uniref:Pimeloyl-ACP methyl ester carboxylesterase n=1 Tax=Streptacidiphilus jiangxiensis TaxID=235985 RepID=A0A1H7N8W6_STRJI|nr:alpha/beta hydrolase [Streptacidiphilus jiangxiensis]SEL19731.1 Pimeloyl-ACP methyl ester carboxylesterase [Streptacidiphilus jiangxiensis]